MDICKPKAGFRLKITEKVSYYLKPAFLSGKLLEQDWDIVLDLLLHEGHRVGRKIVRSKLNQGGSAGERELVIDNLGLEQDTYLTVRYFVLGDFLEISEIDLHKRNRGT